jgi:5-methylcytosine-specific restriction endonuclease McrA
MFQMRAACRCGNETGRIETKSGQDCVYCLSCGKHCYNAPKTETGREVRSLRTRPDIKPGQRAGILERDNATCVLCHRADVALDVGHLISVDAGEKLGLSKAELYDDENLAAMCQPCNSGLSSTPVSLRFMAALLKARLAEAEAA